MEQDRYQQNSKLFVVGLICLLISLSLFALSFYILPYLLWSWRYDVPAFIINLQQWYKETYNFSDAGASWMVFLTVFIPAIIAGFVSQFSSNRIDNEIYHIKETAPKKHAEIKKEVQATLSFGLKVFLLAVLVFVAVIIVEWLVAPPTV